LEKVILEKLSTNSEIVFGNMEVNLKQRENASLPHGGWTSLLATTLSSFQKYKRQHI